jgi:hypothetical protein
MTVTLPLKQMSSADKIELMECLWSDLCSTPEEVESPAWHDEVLECRERALANGDERVLDWSEAKERIRESVS